MAFHAGPFIVYYVMRVATSRGIPVSESFCCSNPALVIFQCCLSSADKAKPHSHASVLIDYRAPSMLAAVTTFILEAPGNFSMLGVITLQFGVHYELQYKSAKN